MSYTEEIGRDGFAILENTVDSNKLRLLEKNCSTSKSITSPVKEQEKLSD